MTIAKAKRALHELRYSCGVNQRYHQRMASRWAVADKLSKIAVAVVATMALVATFLTDDFKSFEIVVAAIAALLAMILNVVPFGERVAVNLDSHQQLSVVSSRLSDN